MSLRILFQTGWVIFRRTWLIWVFALIVFAFSLADQLIPAGPNEVAAVARALIVGLAGLYGETGVIYCAANALRGQPISFGQAQGVFASRFLRLVILAGVPALLITVVPSLVIAVIISAQPGQSSFGFISTGLALLNLALLFLGALLYPFLFYCLSEVIVRDRPLLIAVSRGWRIFLRYMPLSVLIGLIFFALWVVVRAAGEGIYLATQGPAASPLVGMDLFGILQHLLLSSGAQLAGTLLFALFLDPLERIMLSKVYLHAIGEDAAVAGL